MSQIQFGMPTLIEVKSLEAGARLCKELGLRFIELNMNLPEYQADRIDAGEFAEIAQRYGIYYTIHLDENLNPCDFNRTVADAYTDTVLRTIELAKQLRVPVLNMHLSKGVYFTLPEKKVYLFDEYMDVYLNKLIAFRDQCEEAIGEADIKICVENADGYNKEFLQRGLAFLLESKVFALTFDIGHNAGIGGGDEKIIMKYKNKLCHMHMHDAREKSSHLPLGAGELDLLKYFHLAKTQNCRVVLETKTIAGLKESLEWIKNRER
ncbi:MAG: sugar phosphate isomerase/epimerase family protein [Clostridiaceae bacterium]|nr:sugar phosphate isomerase/epimerase family protein [Clostridiaceae bacterium]